MKAQDYADAVAEMNNPKPCKHGHMECALFDGGPCSDEMLARAEAALVERAVA